MYRCKMSFSIKAKKRLCCIQLDMSTFLFSWSKTKTKIPQALHGVISTSASMLPSRLIQIWRLASFQSLKTPCWYDAMAKGGSWYCASVCPVEYHKLFSRLRRTIAVGKRVSSQGAYAFRSFFVFNISVIHWQFVNLDQSSLFSSWSSEIHYYNNITMFWGPENPENH